jgi:hypothetical protein
MEVNERPLVYVGAKAIGTAVGVNWKNIRHYIDDMGLPAFRVGGVGPWVALPDDLADWVRRQRDEQLKT